jgi:hypothetical protein
MNEFLPKQIRWSLFDKGVFPIWQVMMGKKSQEYDSKVEKSLADKLGDWSKGWPGGEMALNGWVRFIKCLFVSWANGNLLLVVVCLYLLQAFQGLAVIYLFLVLKVLWNG